MKYPFLKYIRNTSQEASREAERLNRWYIDHEKKFVATVKEISAKKYGVYINPIK